VQVRESQVALQQVANVVGPRVVSRDHLTIRPTRVGESVAADLKSPKTDEDEGDSM